MNHSEREFFVHNGFVNLGQVLGPAELGYFLDLFDQDRMSPGC
jgi:hypothetical protein